MKVQQPIAYMQGLHSESTNQINPDLDRFVSSKSIQWDDKEHVH